VPIASSDASTIFIAEDLGFTRIYANSGDSDKVYQLQIFVNVASALAAMDVIAANWTHVLQVLQMHGN